ncbi:lysozyme inhibitor LprI family protein [Phenylobacterium parvum]|uniref:Lysozyme inhibitor LprI-like N-terminal domain-containing protein n=1 Tax=Phenylobacterium parvum TaxID=2201350 RepID=A0A2Z3HWH7_9CAUL|nr:lysozyme inhibitor LprI family protein [Phenylobacterium parvum]AWM77169.1 hypothetical protein HYN04_04970 [Phenylobacterium parvum]
MKSATILPVLAIGALLSGCGAAATDCASQASRDVITSIVREQVEKAAEAGLAAEDGTKLASASKIRATVAELKVLIEDIRTTKKDPDSTKRFCAGTARVVVPLSMIQDADQTRKLLDMSTVDNLLEQAGLKRSADSVTFDLEFSVQPTDKRDKIYGEVEGAAPMFTALGEVVGAHLARREIEGASQAQAAEMAAAEAETAKQTEAAQKADLDLATAENKLANQQINTLWKNLPEAARSQLLELQRAWVRKKTADCNIEASGVSTEAMPKEAARLRCDTRLTMERISELQSLME